MTNKIITFTVPVVEFMRQAEIYIKQITFSGEVFPLFFCNAKLNFLDTDLLEIYENVQRMLHDDYSSYEILLVFYIMLEDGYLSNGAYKLSKLKEY